MNKIIFGGLLLCFLIAPSLQKRNSNDRGSDCRYWCENDKSQYYCCENDDQRPRPVGEKKGSCPPVRPSCPGVGAFAGPKTCSNDFSCSGRDKCCYDVCLQLHVCKPPQKNSIGSSLGSSASK
ncbi:UNVERIFIED_CONTAM: hypothetical protein RMT77_015183 [Armadillidium vulgare]